ncbi:MAG: ATP-binding protein [Proteobacteria bacterium]|nr:ATP-binding protein [Pseudomonadota bacterium]
MKKKHFERLLKPPKTSFFLLGMRGVGKTSWVKQYFPKAHFIDLLDESIFQDFLQEPKLFSKELNSLESSSWVIVDEIQRLPNLLNEVHKAIEDRELKFALLGSSARKLRKVGVNLLGGRALNKNLHPLLPQELKNEFSLDKVLEIGSIPLILNAPSPKEQLESYMQLYLKEEIKAEALVRNLPGFARFLPVSALFHAQVLNIEGLARDAGVARSTVQGYLEILEDTLLAWRLPAFEGRLRVKEKRHPKFYWADPGLARAAKKDFSKPKNEELGHLFEGFIAATLKSYHELNLLDYESLNYWSAGGSSNNVEVDFLINRGSEIIAIEVKYAEKVKDDFLKGLKAISELKEVKRKILVYRGERKLKLDDGIEVLPFKNFLEELEKGRL